ncbi:MAG: hypothetical protein WCA07_02550 [Gloeobacterales cyanobacterium]
MMRSLGAMASILILSQTPMAMAGKIIIPVNQNQTAVNVGTQNPQAGGGAGNTTQTGVLQQDISQSQSVNIYVPESFQGKIQVRDGAQGQGNGNQGQGFDRREGRGRAYGHDRENDHRDHEGKGRGERGRD